MPSRPTPSSPGQQPRCTTSPPPPRASCGSTSRAEQPFAPLDSFLKAFDGRVLIAADSPGRREVLQEMLRAHRHEVALVPDWEAFAGGAMRLALTVAPDLEGLTLTIPAGRGHFRGAAVRGARPPGAPAQARRGSGSDPARPARPESRRSGGARGVRRRPLPRAHADGDRRPARRVPGARVPGRRPHLRAGARRCTWSAATPAQRPRARRCTSSAPTSGRGRASAPPSRSAMWPRSCSTCTRAARRSRACRCRPMNSTTRPSPTPSRSRRPRTRPRPSARCWRTLRSARPMDRIVCGDVGFGKTEVAMRAAFVAVAGRQAGRGAGARPRCSPQQHLANFRDRFADWPVRIEALSRFRQLARKPRRCWRASSRARSTS